MDIDPKRQIFSATCGTQAGRARLEGRRIVIVGAGQQSTADIDTVGTGRAMSILFAREGAAVACADVNMQAAEETAELVSREGGRGLAIEVDVTVPEQVQALYDKVRAEWGGVDGVVANVGISTRRNLLEEEVDSWDRVLSVNLRGHMLVAKYALRCCEPGSSLLFISSTAAFSPRGRNPAYESSKAALPALCRATLAEGQERGIRANVLAPGMLDTPMGRSASRANPSRGQRILPFGRQGTAWELANAALFLMSEDASYVNGQVLLVDGGMTSGAV